MSGDPPVSQQSSNNLLIRALAAEDFGYLQPYLTRVDLGRSEVLANIGDTELIFTTVEFLDSANAPLALPAAVRADAQRA